MIGLNSKVETFYRHEHKIVEYLPLERNTFHPFAQAFGSMTYRRFLSMAATLYSSPASLGRLVRTSNRRSLATSAQKRKWQREQGNKRFLKKKYAALTTEEVATSNQKSAGNVSWQPLFFLGVFPVFLSVVVVLSRDDLREEVNEKGIGRFLEDYKRWKRKPQITNVPMEEQPLEEESEYDKMMKQLEQKKP